MSPKFAPPTADSIPLHGVRPDGLAEVLTRLDPVARVWAEQSGFAAGPGECLALPDAGGRIAGALVGLGAREKAGRSRFAAAAAASRLPAGTYRLASGFMPDEAAETALGWLFESYRFDRYKSQSHAKAHLVCPEGVDGERLAAITAGEWLTRDLVNTPAADMGPAELEAATRKLGEVHGAEVRSIVGDDLIAANFPMIHAVGRAAAAHRAPRLIDMTWGQSGPQVTLVGKGVCFDTGGLDIKPASSMGLMKKDMGGAATVLGLASMIMALDLPVRLRVLIPAVENSVSADAFRPQDILTSRKGLTVEINNTDAEGRLVLADALTHGAEAGPDLMISMATLTGAARVAVGPDIAPFFTDDDDHAEALMQAGIRTADPVWRLPFHDAYEKLIEPGIADLDNAPGGGMAGAITAALFLRRFAGETRYVHFDIYAWQATAAPGRPKGGVGQGARAVLDALPKLVGL